MAAKIHCVVVPNTITKLLPFEEVSLTVNRLTELNFDHLLESLTVK